MKTFGYFISGNDDHRTLILRYADGDGIPPSEVRVFEDEARTSKVPLRERPHGGRLVEEIQRGDRLLFVAMEHLSMNPIALMAMIAKWGDEGVEVALVGPKGDVCIVTDPKMIERACSAMKSVVRMMDAEIEEEAIRTGQNGQQQ